MIQGTGTYRRARNFYLLFAVPAVPVIRLGNRAARAANANIPMATNMIVMA